MMGDAVDGGGEEREGKRTRGGGGDGKAQSGAFVNTEAAKMGG